jgi:hypothetical protein
MPRLIAIKVTLLDWIDSIFPKLDWLKRLRQNVKIEVTEFIVPARLTASCLLLTAFAVKEHTNEVSDIQAELSNEVCPTRPCILPLTLPNSLPAKVRAVRCNNKLLPEAIELTRLVS